MARSAAILHRVERHPPSARSKKKAALATREKAIRSISMGANYQAGTIAEINSLSLEAKKFLTTTSQRAQRRHRRPADRVRNG
jgi:hypothetical protein